MAAQNKRKVEKVRAQNYQARQRAQRERLRIIKKDNVIAIVLVVLAIIALIVVQIFVAGQQDSKNDTPDGGTDSTGNSIGDKAPDPALAENREWNGTLSIDKANMEFTLFGDKAPQAVSSFVHLIQEGFFDGVACHRLVPDGPMQILQCGDPEESGLGGPGYTFGPIENAPLDDLYLKGQLAMARVGNDANSNGSQFFILFDDATIHSDNAGGYTVFGEITSGLNELTTEVKDAGTKPGEGAKPVADAKITEISVK